MLRPTGTARTTPSIAASGASAASMRPAPVPTNLRWFWSMTVNGPMTRSDRVATLEEAKAQFHGPECHARQTGYELVSSSSRSSPTATGTHHVRWVETKKLDETGGDGDPKRGIRQGQGRARAIR